MGDTRKSKSGRRTMYSGQGGEGRQWRRVDGESLDKDREIFSQNLHEEREKKNWSLKTVTNENGENVSGRGILYDT